jgi:alcohol dehydrogenase (cytochrome c)
MTLKKLSLILSLVAVPTLIVGQGQVQNQGGLDPASLLKPLEESWPTYSGDYTGRRYSRLTQINRETVKHLTLNWTMEVTSNVPGFGAPAGAGPAGRGGGAGGRGGGAGGGLRTVVGGEGNGEVFVGASAIKGSILKVDDVLYVTAPDHAWAIDARNGQELWHYYWKTRGGTHIGSRGAALWHNYLYFETPDNYLVSLDARTGEERWHVEIASFEE